MEGFSLDLGKKTPITPKGHLDANTDINQITECWTVYSTANIETNPSASALIAFNVDAHKADCNWSEYRRCKIFDAVFTQKSPVDGFHYLFEVNTTNDFKRSPCLWVDIKHKGYIVLALSTFWRQVVSSDTRRRCHSFTNLAGLKHSQVIC